MEYTVSAGTPDLADIIAGFQVDMARETEDFALDPATVNEGVRRMFAMPERGFYVVARDGGGETVASLLVLKEWSDWRCADVWWIHSVYVHPDHRRHGVYRAMFRFVEDRARTEGIAGLRLYVERDNSRAKAAYKSLGMSDDHYDLFEKMLNRER